jgi:feruloyl esterase
MIRPLAAAVVLAAAPLLAAAPARAQAPARACAELTALRIPDVRVVSAELVVPAPRWTAPPIHAGGPQTVTVGVAFCRVTGTIEDEIAFEQWLPLPAAWNGRLLATGNGGFAGFIRYDGLALGVTRGFASVSTDTGHRETETNWSLGHPRRLENYGHRAQHLLAVNAKRILAAFYGRAPDRSYFLGCSGGGMQAMNEVQRYPADYDGVVASAAGQSIVGISARWLQSALYAQRDPANSPTPADWSRIAADAVRRCDAADGLADGILSRPDRCRARIADTPGLSPGKLAVAQALAGPVTGRGGAVLFPGFPPGVAYLPLTEPGRAGEAFAQWLYGDAGWDPAGFDAGRDVPLLEASVPGLSFTNPDLSAFAARGGKLITAHGWADPIVPAQSTIDYRLRVGRFLGEAATDGFFRTFLAPGVLHCGGGDGPDRMTLDPGTPAPVADADHDLLAAIVRWVEEGRAPDRIVASKLDGDRVVMARPVCAWPRVARYLPGRDPARPEAFRCADP